MDTRSTKATLPPSGLSGLDPGWSTLISAVDSSGIERTWHALDTGAATALSPRRGTVLCVHGNPNWSYMWRRLAATLTDWRVVAIDALNMGYSERTGDQRRLAEHVADLVAVTEAMDLAGPIVTVAHDWGGPISMGWAQQNSDRLAGVVLMNTGVARPESTRVPPLISIARSTLRATCETTPMFLHGALRMARPQLDRNVYRGYAAPYRSAVHRTGIRDFVEDIPIQSGHPTHDTLAGIAAGMDELKHVPSLLLWGAKDIVFSDAFLHDLVARMPHAKVHRYPDAGHQIIEDTNAVEVIKSWMDTPATTEAGRRQNAAASPASTTPISTFAGSHTAMTEMMSKDASDIARSISFDELDAKVELVAHNLLARGAKKGDRVATLVPPGIDLTALVYGCLRAGIIVVAPDAALGFNGMKRALRSARPDYVVGDWRGDLLARTLRLPASRLPVAELMDGSRPTDPLARPSDNDVAAIVFTSGSTGPSKGVVYTHGQLVAQRDAARQAFDIKPDDRMVVAFAPFAVLAPALGIGSVIPIMDVTAPATLHAATVKHAAQAINATMLFASPAVLANIAATATDNLTSIRSVVTAGAPVSPQLLTVAQPVFPGADFFTPYGMTEVMPVTVAAASEIEHQHTVIDQGVCVGRPLPLVDVRIHSVDSPHELCATGALGEVWIRADHAAQGYDHLWAQQQHAFAGGWHRSGDVGHLDTQGRLWIEGRVDHLIHTSVGALAPVGIELAAESVPVIDQAAAVGIGPAGTQQLVVVVTGPATKGVIADAMISAAVRTAVGSDLAAVLVASKIPVDRRHNSKVDRTRVQEWAERVLRGEPRRRL